MEAILRLVDSIHEVPDEVKFQLRNALKEKQVSKYEVILKAGQISKYKYFIEKGLLLAYYFKGELEVSAWFMKERDVFFPFQVFLPRSRARKAFML